MRRAFALISLILSVLLSNCQDNSDVEKLAPQNLTLNATISADGSGIVDFMATADNATHYKYVFGEITGEAPFDSDNGEASHTYLNSGTYTVKVSAFSKDELSIDKSMNVTIQVDEPPVTATGFTSPTSYPGYALVWSDEFDGDQLDMNSWTHETGNNNGWGNNELQSYVGSNAIVQDGYLTIKAEAIEGTSYISSRIITKDKRAFSFGRVDIRALMPKGQGIWPALWMLGSNISEPGVGWPKCGEIDIMEMVGGGAGKDDTAYGTAHWDNAGTHASYGGSTTLSPGKILADDFHVYSIVWTDSAIVWYLDNEQYHVIDITPEELNELRQEFFFIFNIAVGGNWPGSPNASTVFPQRMIVDYIRVFQPD